MLVGYPQIIIAIPQRRNMPLPAKSNGASGNVTPRKTRNAGQQR